jgi:hypothetical protein
VDGIFVITGQWPTCQATLEQINVFRLEEQWPVHHLVMSRVSQCAFISPLSE